MKKRWLMLFTVCFLLNGVGIGSSAMTSAADVAKMDDAAETEDTVTTEETIMSERVGEDKTAIFEFDANATTGYAWTGFVLGGNSVELADASGSYVPDENPDLLDGVGGKTYFTLTPVAPGQSIVSFQYARDWEERYEQRLIILADVDEDLNMTTSDITYSSMEWGTVVEVDEANHSVALDNGDEEPVVAVFAEDLDLPLVDEEVCLYTNGIMTMSLPPIVNVLAWETIPSEYGRALEETETE